MYMYGKTNPGRGFLFTVTTGEPCIVDLIVLVHIKFALVKNGAPFGTVYSHGVIKKCPRNNTLVLYPAMALRSTLKYAIFLHNNSMWYCTVALASVSSLSILQKPNQHFDVTIP